MTTFLFGVLSSLAASVIVLILGLLRGSHPLWWLLALGSRYSGIGLSRVYRHQSAAEADLARDLSRARSIKVLAGRGNVLTREAFSPLWSGTLPMESVQILLPDPRLGTGWWLERRSCDVGKFDAGFTPHLLRSQVQSNISYVCQAARNQRNFELRGFDLPHTCRVIATDQVAYLTFYSSSAHGRNSPCLYARAPGLLYTVALQLFEAVWTGSWSVASAT